MTTELLGAAQEITFIDVILRYTVCGIRMAVLSGAQAQAVELQDALRCANNISTSFRSRHEVR